MVGKDSKEKGGGRQTNRQKRERERKKEKKEKEKKTHDCFYCQSICSVISLDSGMSRIVHPQ